MPEREAVLAYEGYITSDNRILDLGALYWKDLPLPVFRMKDGYSGMRDKVGNIVELRREDNIIWATMDIELPWGCALSLDGMDADIDYRDEGMMFKKMRVAGGTIIPLEYWAWKEQVEY